MSWVICAYLNSTWKKMQGCCSMFAPQSRYRDSSRYISVPREDDGNSRTRNPPVLFSPPKILSPSSCKRNLGIHRFREKNCRETMPEPWWVWKPWRTKKRKNLIHMGVSKNRGKTPKMDGLYWKTLLKFMIWGYPYFWTHPYSFSRDSHPQTSFQVPQMVFFFNYPV